MVTVRCGDPLEDLGERHVPGKQRSIRQGAAWNSQVSRRGYGEVLAVGSGSTQPHPPPHPPGVAIALPMPSASANVANSAIRFMGAVSSPEECSRDYIATGTKGSTPPGRAPAGRACLQTTAGPRTNSAQDFPRCVASLWVAADRLLSAGGTSVISRAPRWNVT
jgi:hypothetical protein